MVGSGEEGTSPKRTCIRDNDAEILKERNEVLNSIFKLYFIICVVICPKAFTDPKVSDIEASNVAAGALATVFTAMRKENNRDKSIFNRYNSYAILKYNSKETIVVKSIIDKAVSEGIKFDFAVATPIMNMLTSFKCVFEEIRMGVTKFKLRADPRKKQPENKANQTRKEREYSMSQFRMSPHHITLMEGITYAPERRSGLLSGMGPIALAIVAIHEDQYKDKLLHALEESIKMLPMCPQIISVMRSCNRDSSVQSMLKALADVLALITARTTHRLAIPIEVAYRRYLDPEVRK